MSDKQQVYWGSFTHDDWTFYVAGTERGVCFLTLPNETFATLSAWARKQFSRAELIEDQERLADVIRQLREYLQGARREFDLTYDLQGTPFQMAVWQTLEQIPYAGTLSYSEIATAIGKPQAVRAVGAANGANPLPLFLPCHRVIGKNGKLTGYRGGLDVKERLLQLEASSAKETSPA